MDHMTNDKRARRIDPAKLCRAMSERGLCDSATYFFGKEYFDCCAPADSACAPRPMDELDERVRDMGLTTEELAGMLRNSTEWGSPAPFDFRAPYFCGDREGLLSIKDDDMEAYVTEAIGGEGMEDFIEWCVGYGFITERWLSEGGGELAALLDAPIWADDEAEGPEDATTETNITNDIDDMKEIEEIKESKSVNPAHYGAGLKHECIDVMVQQFGRDKVMAFCQLNALKYLFRMDRKGRPAEDAAKARWYLRRYEKLRRDKANEAALMGEVKALVSADGKGGEA